ncbi:hydroxyacid oxidase 2 isoform X2 [Arvicola amphibius]|uniref:hydroxyacid oxidase 2 isoform X2 n=1 Tax=Arvicola amphibius TaxID=1047088 RepID=UPI0018E3E3FD|nr:hydroxyacid oxidase 2 isoform X2 [Arvicola amphibius]XP_038167746.1 hydroxyacid oxidase 2 isoform X2 [Arvicola amphibius]
MSFVCLADFRAHAREQLSKSSWDFIEGAADEGITCKDNIAAFKRIRLCPRYLRDVSVVDTRTTIQGQEIQAPICISPTAFHSIAWPDGEMSTARAAQEANICYITSTYASCPLEDIVAAAPRGLRWFQLYVQSDWELNKQLIRRVEALGFKALVITVDVPVVAKRRQDIRNQLNLAANLMRMDLRSPEEIDALMEVVAAVKGRVEVYMDGGVRTGNDVLKALALGAKCIFLGRPILWGLTYKGEHGVLEVLNILKAEFHTSMALSGCRSVAEISPDLIRFSRL